MAQAWDNRITGHGVRTAGEFLANPLNVRLHPRFQQEATEGSLNELGWVRGVLVNARTGRVIDGHLRVTLALRRGDDTPVPYDEVDLSEAEEAQALATLDPLAALALPDSAAQDALLREVETGDAALQQLLDELAFDVAPQSIGGSSGGDRTGIARATGSVKAVFSVAQLAAVEAAIVQTGERNRGAALVAICEAYVQATGQLNSACEDRAPAAGPTPGYRSRGA